jgi:hypothetical protein
MNTVYVGSSCSIMLCGVLPLSASTARTFEYNLGQEVVPPNPLHTTIAYEFDGGAHTSVGRTTTKLRNNSGIES